MKKQTLTLLTIISAGIMAGCGSSGTGSGTIASLTTPGSSTASISGKVADGYLVGATVFLDKNGNYQLDAGEPSAITDQNGAYSLSVDPADVGKYPIVAIATKGVTIDKDTGAPVTNTYVLSMPATAISGTANSNFISPMSTQLRELMETGKYNTVQQAMSDLGAKLGMPAGTNMMIDYMNANNTAMHTAARNMASLMGSQMPQIVSSSGSTTIVDVNRYRGMMGTIFSNISSIKGSGSNAQSAMSNLMGTMVSNFPNILPGQPFRNMSAAFRGGMMGGTTISTSTGTGTGTGTTSTPGVMMGGSTNSTSTGTGTGTTPGVMMGGSTNSSTSTGTGTVKGTTTTPTPTPGRMM